MPDFKGPWHGIPREEEPWDRGLLPKKERSQQMGAMEAYAHVQRKLQGDPILPLPEVLLRVGLGERSAE